MARFNRTQSGLLIPSQPLVTQPQSTVRTYNNAPGFEYDDKSQLFLLAVSNFLGQDSFYEKGSKQDARFTALISKVAMSDPDWVKRFLPWLRKEANMRTAAVMGAVDAAQVWIKHKIPGGRQLVASVIARADEPGEMLAYCMQRYGRKVPKSIKRGLADAATAFYTERNLLKYDTASHGFRFGDVLELTHATPRAPWQSHLFKFAIDRRHGRAHPNETQHLPMITANEKLRFAQAGSSHSAHILTDPVRMAEAGMTWEDALSLGGTRVDKHKLWEAMIPSMGYMALLRNLRNFDEAGVSDAVAKVVMEKLSDPHEVAKSRQLPMRFLSAYRAAPNLRWAYPLQQALELSLGNIDKMPGRTLILIDTSGSMNYPFSKDGTLMRWDAAALFGIALGHRCDDATVVSYSGASRQFPLRVGGSVLKELENFQQSYFFGGGTATARTVAEWFKGHDRVIVLTDEQANSHYGHSVFDTVPQHTMAITFNLAGYAAGHAPSGTPTRVTIGGLSDQAFKMLPILEHRAKGTWPF